MFLLRGKLRLRKSYLESLEKNYCLEKEDLEKYYV